MATTLYFYDLETSGIDPREQRIMQFAGQRVDMQLKPVAEPDNILIKLSDDILPEPQAILITGLTPQAANTDGITEAEFLKYFENEIALPGTIFVGYNNVRFDDEFMRFAHYRNFYDAYEWSWRDDRSRWDLLDVVRMTRALRPDGIEWPFSSDGKPSNKLELLASINNLEHTNAHDALSDVNATIALARLIRNKQQKLFEYLLDIRGKNKIKEFIEANKKFVYSSGKFPNAFQKTTVVTSLGAHPGKQGVLVYDLRRNPEDIVHMSPAELAVAWRERVEDETMRFPVKTLQFNRCPAVAPLGVLVSDNSSQENIKIDLKKIVEHESVLNKYPKLYNNLLDALKILDKQRQSSLLPSAIEVDAQLYDGFFGDKDKTEMSVVRAADNSEIVGLDMEFDDQRLNELLPIYKARNFLSQLSTDEREQWEKFKYNRLLAGGENSRYSKYLVTLNNIAGRPNLNKNEMYLLQELQLYVESIMPDVDA